MFTYNLIDFRNIMSENNLYDSYDEKVSAQEYGVSLLPFEEKFMVDSSSDDVLFVSAK